MYDFIAKELRKRFKSLRAAGRVLGTAVVLLTAAGSSFPPPASATEGPAATVDKSAAGIAGRLRIELADRFRTLATLARDPRVREALQAGQSQQLAETAATLLDGLKGGLRLRLIPPRQAVLAPTESPPLTYAALDAIRLAEESTAQVAAEMIMPGTPAQHILLVQRVNDGNGKLLGVLVGQLAPEVILENFSPNPVKAAVVEIRQVVPGSPDMVIGSSDPRASRPTSQLQSFPIPNSRWSIYTWDPTQNFTENMEQGSAAWVIFAAAGTFLCALTAWYLRKRLSGSAKKAGSAGRPRPNLAAASTGSHLLSAQNDAPAEAALVTAKTPHGHPASTDKASITEKEQLMESSLSANSAGSVPDSVFRAYDIRGIVGEGLTEESVYLLGRALGSEALERGQQDIVIARDGRTSGPMLIEALKKGLLDSGRDVIDVGMVPTPVLYWATYFLETHSGVMLTGSHNPANYNGLKIVLDGRALAGDAIIAIRDRIKQRNFASGSGKFHSADLGADYIRRITEDIPVALTRSFKVVVDCGNGVPGILAPRLIRALGHDVTELYCDVDGAFPNHHPDPSQPENLHELIATVKKLKADVGLAFDGDGDRLGVVDGQGNIIWPDRQMMLFARDVLSRNAGAEIIFDVKCSNHLQNVIAEHGGVPLMWKTGHSLIKSKMRETGAPLAGEMSGHIFFKERWYGFDDALYAAARLLEILVRDPRAPAAVFAELPGGVATPELRLDMPEDQHAPFMQQLIDQAEFGADARITTVDGLRVDFADRWALVRASNTTPCLILRFEADDPAALEKIQTQFRQLLTTVQPGLKLPF